MWGLTHSPSTMFLWGKEELASALVKVIQSNTQVQLYVDFQKQIVKRTSADRTSTITAVETTSQKHHHHHHDAATATANNDTSVKEEVKENKKLIKRERKREKLKEEEEQQTNKSSTRRKKEKQGVIKEQQEELYNVDQRQEEEQKAKQQSLQPLDTEVDANKADEGDSSSNKTPHVWNKFVLDPLVTAMSKRFSKKKRKLEQQQQQNKNVIENESSLSSMDSLAAAQRQEYFTGVTQPPENVAVEVNYDLLIQPNEAHVSVPTQFQNLANLSSIMMESQQQLPLFLAGAGGVIVIMLLLSSRQSRRSKKNVVTAMTLSSPSSSSTQNLTERHDVTTTTTTTSLELNETNINKGEEKKEDTSDTIACPAAKKGAVMVDTNHHLIHSPSRNNSTARDTPRSVSDFPSTLIEQRNKKSTSSLQLLSPLTPPRPPPVPPPSPIKKRRRNNRQRSSNNDDKPTTNQNTTNSNNHNKREELILGLFQRIIDTRSLLSQPSKRHNYYNTWIEKREKEQQSVSHDFPKREQIIKWILPDEEQEQAELLLLLDDNVKEEHPVTDESDDDDIHNDDQVVVDQQKQHEKQQQYEAAIVIQSRIRSYQTLSQYQQMKNQIVLLQCLLRTFMAKKELSKLKQKQQQQQHDEELIRTTAIIKVQSFVRLHQTQSRYFLQKKSTLIIQQFVRSFVARKKLTKARAAAAAATTIQAYWRMILGTTALRRRRIAAIQIKEAAIQIQSVARSRQMQSKYMTTRHCFIRFQCLVRCFLAKIKVEALRREVLVVASSVKIQSSVRRMIQMKKYTQILAAREEEEDVDKGTEQTNSVSETSSLEKPTQSQSSSGTTATSLPKPPRMDVRVSMLTTKALTAFRNNDCKGAVLKFTIALKFHTEGIVAEATTTNTDQTHAWILYNRSLALLMIGAYDAAVMDCEDALEVLPQNPVATDQDEYGYFLQARLHSILGRASVRLGAIDDAQEDLDEALHEAQTVLETLHPDLQKQAETYYANSLTTEIEQARDEMEQYRESFELMCQCEDQYSIGTIGGAALKRFQIDALSHVNDALKIAPSDMSLHEKKVNLLVTLKCWRRVVQHCEELAAECSKVVGIFAEDLEEINPYPCISQCKHLTPPFRRGGSTDSSTTTDLPPEAVEEVVLLLSPSLLPLYLRSLRLEEKFAQATSGIASLKDNGFLSAWLLMEEDKLKRTTTAKRKGDGFFYGGYYEKAVERYGTCLKIDLNGKEDNEDDKYSLNFTAGDYMRNNEGGKLNATLFCRRAACLLKLSKYQDAIMECNVALRIHPQYMEAMRVKAQSYVEMKRLDDAIITYERWLQMVKDAPSSFPESCLDDVETTCIFGGPTDVSESQIRIVQQELANAKESREDVWRDQQSTNAADAGSKDDDDPYGFGATAKARREQYAPSSSRRSNNSNPFRAKKAYSIYDQEKEEEQQRSQPSNKRTSRSQPSPPQTHHRSNRRYGESEEEEEGDNDFDFNSWNSPHDFDYEENHQEEQETHYSILQIPLNATSTEIKKAYRTMALQYHPDKNPDPSAADYFRKIQLAYEVLIDDSSRRKYNREIW